VRFRNSRILLEEVERNGLSSQRKMVGVTLIEEIVYTRAGSGKRIHRANPKGQNKIYGEITENP